MIAASIPSRLIAAGSIVAMLAHAFLGCCWHHTHAEDWHHAHAEESDGCEQTDASAAARHSHRPCERDGNTHSVVHSHPAPTDPHSPHEAPCDEPDCSYLASTAPEHEAPIVAFEFGHLTGHVSTGLSTVSGSPTARSIPAASIAQPLSTARLRAALQVWVF